MTEEEQPKDDLEFIDELGLEDFQEYEDLFRVVGEYKQGKVSRDQLKEKLFELRFRKLSDEDLDRIVGETEFTKDGLVSIFNCIIFLKKIIDAGTKEKFQRIKKREGMGLFRVLDRANYKRKARPYSDKEKSKYAKLINKLLKDDPDCKNRVPIDPKGDQLYDRLRDGVILAKLVNLCEPNVVNEDDIKKDDDMNVYDKYANLEKALQGAKAVGVTCETTPDDVLDKDKARDNDLLGEIFARLNAKKKDIKENPETPKLAEGDETPEQIADLPVDDFLKRWFNHHLKAANHPNPLTNWTDDLKDGEKYVVLLNQLNPMCDKSPLDETDPVQRAKKILDNAKKLGVETEVKPEDLADNNEAMNRLFTSDIYNAMNNAGGDDYDKDLMKAYVDTINKELCDDTDTKNKLPINPDNEEVFDKLKDGVVLGKLINLADKNALDGDQLKTGDDLKDEDVDNNLDKVVDGADKLRCPHKPNKADLALGRKKKEQELLGDVLGRIKVPPQLIRDDPDADDLVQDGETKEDLATKVPVDDFLKRWVNKHLKLAESPRTLNNYDDDLKDGEIFTILMNDLAPDVCDKSPLDESDTLKRAEKILDNAKKFGADPSVTAEGLTSGNPELNKLFLGEIYNAYANPFDANEKECYCKIINKLLADDPELKEKLPVDPTSNEIFKKMKDGIILCKLINLAAPGTIDERVIVKDPGMTKDDKLNNLNLVINSAKSIGCLMEATADDVLDEVRTKDVDLLYQVLKPIVLKKISVQDFPQLLRLKDEEAKETDEELLTLGPEDFLKRWFNHHLTKANHPNKLNNFSDDVKDSEKYTILLNQLSPDQCGTDGLGESDLKKRAATVLENAPKVGANVYIKDEDIPSGNEHLNTLFTAELFMANHGMGEATPQEKMTASKLLEDDDEGGREERSFRTWINSLKLEGVKKVNNLYEECRSAILLLKMIDKIKPGTVQWKKVELKTKNPFKIGVNCQEVIDASKRSGYSIISIGNKDIQEGKKKHILAIVWQLMRAHTLKIIGEKSEEELIQWANSKVPENRKIKSLKEKKLNDGLFWIDLLAAIEPRSIRWDLVVKENLTDKDREMNAKYALSVARGLGAMIFVVWEDITEVKSKLLLTLLASLYDVAQNREKKN